MNQSEKYERDGRAIVVWVLIGLALYKLPLVLMLVSGLFKLALIAGTGYVIVFLYRREKRTKMLSRFFNQIQGNPMLQDKDDENVVELKKKGEDTYELPPEKEDGEIDLRLELLQEQLENVKLENERLRQNQVQVVEDSIQKYVHHIDRQNKAELLENVFGTESSPYSRSDQYEKEKIAKQRREREEHLTNREFRQEMKEQLHDVRVEGKEERFVLRTQMQEGFLYLDKQYSSLKEFMIEKIYFLNSKIDTNHADVKLLVGNLRVEIKEELGDFKLKVGQGFLQVLEKLENYNTRVERYSYEVKKATLDAERFSVRGERMLNQAQSLYAKHKAEITVLGKELDVSIQKVALHKGDFANKVASAKLMLDRSTQEQVDALKEIAHEKMGVQLLRQSHSQRIEVAETRMHSLIKEKRHIEDKMRLHQNNSKTVGALQHKLFVNQENLSYEKNRNSIMRQEFALFKRLSK